MMNKEKIFNIYNKMNNEDIISKAVDLHFIVDALIEYIDAIPNDVVASLPVMPGISRDFIDEVLDVNLEVDK